MENSKLSKVLKILIVPEILLALYVMFFWFLPFLLNTAVSFSRL
ncbi:MAG TPA: hypothetical protein VFK11_04615 [Candidatus Saccharimonadales bacterium]|nr:hypothetical protein [Candidatus Saccharimonadales bacterium]